jgi:hypothetical protein
MTENTTSTQQVSKYNSAVAQLFRLDELWKDAHRHSRSGNYMSWNADLDKIWSELARDLKLNCKEEKEYNQFMQQLGNNGNMAKQEIKGFNSSKNDKANTYMILLRKEIWLGRLQNQLGKGTKWDEGEDDYFS